MRPAQAVMADLAASGLTAEQLALVMELSATVAVEARPSLDVAAENKRSYDREYQRSRRKSRTRSYDDNDESAPPKENISNPPSSEANASGSEAADPVKELFDLGVALLTATGCDDKQARSLLGKWRKAKGEAEVLQALLDCRARSISNPVEWLTKRFQGGKWVSPKGYEYRGTDQQVLREAEKRNDMTTYWAVKRAMKDHATAAN